VITVPIKRAEKFNGIVRWPIVPVNLPKTTAPAALKSTDIIMASGDISRRTIDSIALEKLV
jgi:hypothetical protein